MLTECIQAVLDLGGADGRRLVWAFDGGAITSNGGVVLVAGAGHKVRLAERLAACFTDHRLLRRSSMPCPTSCASPFSTLR